MLGCVCMVRYLSSYIGDYKVFVVSKSENMTNQLLLQGLNVGELSDFALKLLPDETIIPILENERSLFDAFDEGDVLDINESGIIFRWYSVADGDAGIATTALCNSNCIMCPASDGERRQNNTPTIRQLDDVIRHMPRDLWHFTVTGGEPTLIGEDNFIDIIKSINKWLPNTKILLLTNGRTLGDKEFFQKFAAVKPPNMRIAIPIHGSTAEKHDHITRADGSFKQTMRGISNLLSIQAEVEIRIVVSQLNCDDILNIAELIVELFPNVTVVHFVGLEMRGNCVVYPNEVLISYQEAFAKSKSAINYLIRNGVDVALYNFPYCMIEKGYWPIAQKSISAYKSMFYDECNSCKLKEECCGIFSSTMNYYKPKVYPIVNED